MTHYCAEAWRSRAGIPKFIRCEGTEAEAEAAVLSQFNVHRPLLRQSTGELIRSVDPDTTGVDYLIVRPCDCAYLARPNDPTPEVAVP